MKEKFDIVLICDGILLLLDNHTDKKGKSSKYRKYGEIGEDIVWRNYMWILFFSLRNYGEIKLIIK